MKCQGRYQSWNRIYDGSKLFDYFFVGSALGFNHLEVGIGSADDPAGPEEEKARISVVPGHDSFDDGWDSCDYPSGNPTDHIEHHDLLRRDYFRDVRPRNRKEGSTIDQHKQGHKEKYCNLLFKKERNRDAKVEDGHT